MLEKVVANEVAEEEEKEKITHEERDFFNLFFKFIFKYLLFYNGFISCSKKW